MNVMEKIKKFIAAFKIDTTIDQNSSYDSCKK